MASGNAQAFLSRLDAEGQTVEGGDEDERKWLVYYHDKEVPPELFVRGGNAEECARKRHANQLGAWSCHLFREVFPGEQVASGAELTRLKSSQVENGGPLILLQLALDELAHVVDAVDYQYDAKPGHLKYTTPWHAVNSARKVRDDILAQAAAWGIAIAPRREPAPLIASSQAEHDRTVREKAFEEAAQSAESLHDQDCGDIAEYCFAGRQIAKAIRSLKDQTGGESGT